MEPDVDIYTGNDELLEHVGLVAHRYVEGSASYKDLVAAVKDYAKECSVPITPADREPVAQQEVKPEPAASVEPNTVGLLEPALERRIAKLRSALGKSDNAKKVKQHCDALFVGYTDVNVQRWRSEMREMLRASREAKMQAGKDARA